MKSDLVPPVYGRRPILRLYVVVVAEWGCNSRTCGLLQVQKHQKRVRFTKQSGVQRNSPGLLLKSREMGVILQFFLSNRTRESLALSAAGQLSGRFLWRPDRQSGFQDVTGECNTITNRSLGESALACGYFRKTAFQHSNRAGGHHRPSRKIPGSNFCCMTA